MLNLNEKWTQVLAILKEEIPGESYNTWVLPLVPSAFEDNKLTLFSPHSFTAVTLKQSYGDIITKALTAVFKEPVNFEVVQDKVLAENFEKAQKK